MKERRWEGERQGESITMFLELHQKITFNLLHINENEI